MAEIKNITTEAELNELVATGKTVLVDFWATWCGPCQMLGKILEQVAADAPADAVIAKVDVDPGKDLAVKFQVGNVPVMVLFKNGAQTQRLDGIKSKPTIAALFN